MFLISLDFESADTEKKKIPQFFFFINKCEFSGLLLSSPPPGYDCRCVLHGAEIHSFHQLNESPAEANTSSVRYLPRSHSWSGRHERAGQREHPQPRDSRDIRQLRRDPRPWPTCGDDHLLQTTALQVMFSYHGGAAGIFRQYRGDRRFFNDHAVHLWSRLHGGRLQRFQGVQVQQRVAAHRPSGAGKKLTGYGDVFSCQTYVFVFFKLIVTS